MDALDPLPLPRVMFQGFQERAKTPGGARELFQQLITDLVSVQHPLASEVALPSGSDWGIDTFTGKLDDAICVWQSKFFPEWTGSAQQIQVRNSFNEVIEKSISESFHLSAWTLCVPCILPPKEQQWFDNWSTRKAREEECIIQLWNGTKLRQLLMTPDARGIRDCYFPTQTREASPPEPHAEWEPSETSFENALFVLQLEAAGRKENDVAKGMFFAADALSRDIEARGNESRIQALNSIRMDIHDGWESHYNQQAAAADASGIIPGLVDLVMSNAAAAANPPNLNLRKGHRKGLMHLLVERGQAGWVTHWRTIVNQVKFDAAKGGTN